MIASIILCVIFIHITTIIINIECLFTAMESRYLRNANDNKNNICNIKGNSYDAIDNEKATMIFDDNYISLCQFISTTNK